MQLNQLPDRLTVAFAQSGTKNTIPVASQIGIVNGRASFTDGFPPLTMTPLSSGGVPPFGQDQNGILFALSVWLRWASAGGGVPFNTAFATDAAVGGHPKGARILRSDGEGYWLNTTDNNQTDPEATGVTTNWVSDAGPTGVTAVTGLTNANVTLTPIQWGRTLVTLAGALTGNVQINFPNGVPGMWLVKNNTSGAFSVTCKTVSGTGAIIASGSAASLIWSDGTNMFATTADFTTLNALFMRHAVNSWNADAAGANRFLFGSAGSTSINGFGATPVVFTGSGAALGSGAFVRSDGRMVAGADAVAAVDLMRLGQSNSRAGYTYTAADWSWQDRARGLIRQWGVNTVPGNNVLDVTLPISYSTTHLRCWATLDIVANGLQNSIGSGIPGVAPQATIRLVNNNSNPATISWESIGY